MSRNGASNALPCWPQIELAIESRNGRSVLFAFAARGYGSRSPVRDLGIGVALTLPVFWLFTMGLGLSLPQLVNAWI